MKQEEYIKLYISQGDNASNFLDKAILTLSTSIIGGITLLNIQERVVCYQLFVLAIIFMFLTLILVILSYLLAIYNTQVGLSSFGKDINEKKKIRISENMQELNTYINYLRYTYSVTSLIGLLLLILSII